MESYERLLWIGLSGEVMRKVLPKHPILASWKEDIKSDTLVSQPAC